MRLFIAIDPPETVRKQIITLLGKVPTGKTVPPHQLHLTLRFIGEVDTKKFKEIQNSLRQIKIESFELRFVGVGCFPTPKRPRVLWAGLLDSSPLIELKKEIDQVLKKTGLEEENRPFHPHLTLARIKFPKSNILDSFLQDNFNFQTESFDVKDFHLYSSQLTPKGAIHQRELTIELS